LITNHNIERGNYPLVAPATKPLAMYFLKIMAIRAGGIRAINPPELIIPKSWVFFVTNSVITTVNGLVVGDGAIIRGIKN